MPAPGDTHPSKRTGRLPRISDPRALLFPRFAQPRRALPPRSDFWLRRKPFILRSYGNRGNGCCTIASQGNDQTRLERLEVRRSALITDDEVLRVYYAMTFREYGAGDGTVGNPAGDVGAYETHALNNWRRPEQTFRDTKGRPLTIDAYVRVNAADIEEVKNAILTAAHGIKFCINLPTAFELIEPPNDWDIPAGQALTGDWMPGSWGGHSMFARDYDEVGVWFVHTWDLPDQRITWAAWAAYVDEVHMVVDSLDAWRKRPGIKKAFDLPGLKQAVNKVSAQKIA